MVVLASAVMTNPPNKAGKVLLSRQYVDMTRIRIEGLLAALPRLMTAGSQHTFIETESVRYLYQPFESMLIVLVTNKGSNIVEDLETLRMLGMLLTELVPPAPDQGQGSKRTEVEVNESAFDIMFALDELLSMGYRNNITVDRVLTALDMQSQEEESAKAFIKIQVKNAQRKVNEEAERIAKSKKQQKEMGHSAAFSAPVEVTQVDMAEPLPEPVAEPVQKAVQKKPLGGGMKIGGKRSKKDQFAAVLEEDGVEPLPESKKGGAAAGGARPIGGAASEQASVDIGVKEQIIASFDSEGNLLELPKVKGSLSLTVPNREHSFFEVQFNRRRLDRRNFDLRLNPKLDAKLFEEKALLKSKPDTKVAFPIGPSLQVLKWGLRPDAKFEVPLTLSIWGDEDNILVQYELSDTSKEFVNAVIRIPACGSTGSVEEEDVCHYNGQEDCFVWHVPRIDADTPQAGVNITWSSPVPVADLNPLTIEFQSPSSLAGVEITDVLPVGPGALWYRRRSLICCAGRRSSALGKLAQKYPEALKNIAEFL
eukprot:TRINITY_DN43268_c0_g1_i1.p2 TRINITY_DN43268_c0_g1~~TRINITY_DN43268_c0_g1_i1.p2  ORF type:complete len:537 (+),score=267.02 TRINITY_DN43268_c0_g1_i1:58-1668(+)